MATELLATECRYQAIAATEKLRLHLSAAPPKNSKNKSILQQVDTVTTGVATGTVGGISLGVQTVLIMRLLVPALY